jgi:hypothetical protein
VGCESFLHYCLSNDHSRVILAQNILCEQSEEE